MKILNIKKGFTLIELLVWITIIWILLLAATSLNFNRLSNRQKLEIFTNSIKTNFETIRNYSLEWKWIWSNLNVPNIRTIEFSKSKILSKADWTSYSSIDVNWNFNIINISCLDVNKALDTNVASWSWIIEFKWSVMTLTWQCNIESSKILKIEVRDKSFDKKTLFFNTLNWLVETK